MTILPAAGNISGVVDQGAAKAHFEAMRDVVAELPGGQAMTALTLAAGAVVPTGAVHTVDTEAQAATDDLANIDQSHHPDGRLLLIRAADNARVVTVKHAALGAGAVILADGADFILDDVGKWLLLLRVGTQWLEVMRAFGGDSAARRAFIGLGPAAVLSTGTATGQLPLAETVLLQGLHTIAVPAAAMIANVTAGCGKLTVLETATNGVNLPNLPFDANADETASFVFPAPKSADETAGFTVRDLAWSHAATTTTFTVRWGVRMLALSDAQGADSAFGAEITLEDTGGVTDEIYLAPESAVITPGGGWVAGDLIVLEVTRKATHVNDTLAIDARLHGLKLMMTVNAGTDS